MQIPNAPLFRDPIFDGAADPTILWNHQEQAWWILYTNRRANVSCQRLAWAHGTDIGIASSTDQGKTWLYRGVLPGLEFEPGRNTFWAPEILWHDGLYHMYVSYVPGVPIYWTGKRDIVHMTSKDLWNWKFESRLNLSSERVIDACVFQMPNGMWRMWYKDEVNHSHTFLAESIDLYSWQVKGPVITDCPHEGPNVFFWNGFFWMITDPWEGLGVYRSEDATHWTRQANILSDSGTRADDYTMALHADVLINDDKAYVFYFTHPDRSTKIEPAEPHPLSYKRSSIQVAELEFNKGMIICSRNKPFDFHLSPGS